MTQKLTIIITLLVSALLAPAGLEAQTIYPTGTTIHEPGTQAGYTLFAGADGIIYLIDMDGSVVNSWASPILSEPGLAGVEALDDGRILAYTYVSSSQTSLRAVELDFEGNLLWQYELPSSFPSGSKIHHDSERLPNGNTLLLCSQPITINDISPTQIIDDFILEVDVAGNIVWRWDTWRHFHEFGFDDSAKDLISIAAGDWAHANSIAVIPPNNHTDPALTAGNIIVSQRLTNTIFIIDKITRDIVWKIGPGDHQTFGQHDPHMIRQGLNGEGNIIVFDNGSGVGYPLSVKAPGISRVHEIDPTTKTFTWTYRGQDSGLSNFAFWSNIVSGAQRQPNGNTLICAGALGRIFEIAPDGSLLWEYISPYKSSSGGAERLVVFRAYRLPYTWVEVIGVANRRSGAAPTPR